MKKKLIFLKRIRKILIVICFGIFLSAGGCYKISYIIQPDVVSPNSAFNVDICVIHEEDWEASDYFPAYGFLGILLPEGWIVKDSIKYEASNYDQKGYFGYNSAVVSFLNSHVSQPPSGYYWWGAKSVSKIDLAPLVSGNINLTILTDSQTGQFNTKYILGDDTDWNKIVISDLFGKVSESELIPIKSSTTTQAVTSWKNENWEVYPNPSNGQITIRQGKFPGEVVLKVYDLSGRIQSTKVLRESPTQVDFSNLSKGTYILSLEKRGEIRTKRLLIQ